MTTLEDDLKALLNDPKWERVINVARDGENRRIATANHMSSAAVRTAYHNGNTTSRADLESVYIEAAKKFLGPVIGTGKNDGLYRAQMDSILGRDLESAMESLRKGNIDSSDPHDPGFVQICENAFMRYGLNSEQMSINREVQNQPRATRDTLCSYLASALAMKGNASADMVDRIGRDPYEAINELRAVMRIATKYHES